MVYAYKRSQLNGAYIISLPKLNIGDIIQVKQWRQTPPTWFNATVESDINNDEDVPYVCYHTNPINADTRIENDGKFHHHAGWNHDEQIWEDGEF